MSSSFSINLETSAVLIEKSTEVYQVFSSKYFSDLISTLTKHIIEVRINLYSSVYFDQKVNEVCCPLN